MKKIGSIFGIDVYQDKGIDPDKIIIVSPTEETMEKVRVTLEKLFSPGGWEFIKREQ